MPIPMMAVTWAYDIPTLDIISTATELNKKSMLAGRDSSLIAMRTRKTAAAALNMMIQRPLIANQKAARPKTRKDGAKRP